MKLLLLSLIALPICVACEQRIETPAAEKKETTIVQPPAQKETNTTVIENKTEKKEDDGM